MNIKEIIASGASNVALSISPTDLQEFGREIYKQGRADAAEEARLAAESKPEADPLLTIDEVAERLRVTRSTIFRWRKAGYLTPTAFAGTLPRFATSTINKLADARRIKNPQTA